jgi:uncharacterized protein YqgV (UPF0045/DUF77 family)
MQITAELSFYPLADECIPQIKAYIAGLNKYASLVVKTNLLSTEIIGDYDTVMQAINDTTKKAFATDGSVVLVAKYLNKDRR